jgi:calcineurin-like phosphoesterase family protein
VTAGHIGEGATDLPAKWIISDTHFGQGQIVREAFGRPEDWEHRVRYWWKELVAPEDKVLHLGDVALEIWPPARVREVVGDLPGRITVVPGNWDGLVRLAALQGAGWTVQTRLLAAQYRGFEVFFTYAPMPRALCAHTRAIG